MDFEASLYFGLKTIFIPPLLFGNDIFPPLVTHCFSTPILPFVPLFFLFLHLFYPFTFHFLFFFSVSYFFFYIFPLFSIPFSYFFPPITFPPGQEGIFPSIILWPYLFIYCRSLSCEDTSKLLLKI